MKRISVGSPTMWSSPLLVSSRLLLLQKPGRSCVATFAGLGFAQVQRLELEEQTRSHARSGDVGLGFATACRLKYVACGEMRGPAWRTARFVSVWVVDRALRSSIRSFIDICNRDRLH